MPSTALEIDAPQLCAAQLIERPGSLPTISFPATAARRPDVEGIWHYLRETADFFAVPMPAPALLEAAISARVARVGVGTGVGLVAVDVTIAVSDGAPQLIVSVAPVPPPGPRAARILVDDGVPHAHLPGDPWWRRMAARTTSRGDVDNLERWLNGRGFADCLSNDVPHLGALLVETHRGAFVAVENPEPTSIVDQLMQCGLLTEVDGVDALPRDVRHMWWLSPRYELHRISEVDGARLAFGAEVPRVARWS